MRNQAKPAKGEILEVPIGARFGYVQFIGKHREYGEGILVSPHLHQQRTDFGVEFFVDGYVTFYPVNLALTRNVMRVVARQSAPKLPRLLRRAGATLADGTVTSWMIEGGWREFLGLKHMTRRLTDAELQLPQAAIWNHAMLVQRIEEGWTPATDPRSVPR
jgi:hypothetical protein